MDYTIACSALAAPSQCHPVPVLQSVLVASFLANFLASVYSPEYVEEEFCELRLLEVLGSSLISIPQSSGVEGSRRKSPFSITPVRYLDPMHRGPLVTAGALRRSLYDAGGGNAGPSSARRQPPPAHPSSSSIRAL